MISNPYLVSQQVLTNGINMENINIISRIWRMVYILLMYIKRGLVCILSDPKFGFSSVCMVKFTGGSGDGVYEYVRKNFTDIFNRNL